MKPVAIGIAGLGTVGAGTVRVLQRNGDEIARRAGRRIEVVCAAVRDVRKARDCDTDHITLLEEPLALAADPRIAVVVELIGGVEVARQLALAAIGNGKHLVTANKALIATHGNEIFAAAREHGVVVAFEAAVAGGIPIIKTIREGLSGNRVERLAGIINGTCNYILSGMHEHGCSFDEMLGEAQRLGYAEADPAFDVDGVDAAHKLSILASIAFGIPLQFDKVCCSGIRHIEARDIAYADELGFRIKHLGIAARSDAGIALRVHPALVPQRHLMANVDGVMNAILVHADALGPTMLYGAGAGAEPTASAVVADLVDVVRTLTTDPDNRVPHLAFQPGALADLNIVAEDDIETPYYLRMTALNRPGVLADVTRILGSRGISIEAVLQKSSDGVGGDGADGVVPVILMAQRTRAGNMRAAIAEIAALDTVEPQLSCLSVEPMAATPQT